MIAELERAELLAIARQAIAASLDVPPGPQGPPETGVLARRASAFVTLHRGGALRGCIGHINADRPLVEVVASCAVSAAQSDPRFPPVTADEIAHLHIEISVLSGFEIIQSVTDIEVGRHGLLVERDWRRGLLLPQVAPEWGWDASAFAAHTCRKAGLPTDAWPHGGATMYRFEAEVFGEERDELGTQSSELRAERR